MYTDYFGFRERPFSITPDPRFFYTNPRYQEAYASLLYGIHERRGFIVLTGEIGTGKTTLLRRLMENMEPHIRFVFFYNTTLPYDEILDFICQELGLQLKEAGQLHKIQMLNRFLVDRLATGEIVVLLIDEAQNLTEEVLENLRLLSNLETSTEKLLQIVLVGQPELEVKLNRYELRQLKQRIAIQCRLERLDDEEVGPFIHYRLSAVGYKRQQLFSPDAIQEIANYSKGFPRLINILCDNALLIAYATSQKRISRELVREAAEDLRLGGSKANTFVDAEAPEPSRVLRMRSHPGSPRSETARDHLKRSDTLWKGWRMTAVLLLGLGGIGFYTWRPNAPVLHRFENQISALPRTLYGTLGGWLKDPDAAKPFPRSDSETTGHGESTGLIKEAGPASVTELRSDRQTMEPSIQNRESASAAGQMQGTGGGDATGIENQGTEEAGWAATTPQTTGWRETPMTVQPGATVAEIAATTYGGQRNLGLDLIKEYNAHIENLNRIVAGQRLWLPPVSRETLVRRQPNGSYSLILASHRMPHQSEQLAQVARLTGYDAVVTPRRVSDDLILYRVELNGLENADAVNQAWDLALANQWIAVAGNSSRKQF
jgi:general secretion pathway protein A